MGFKDKNGNAIQKENNWKKGKEYQVDLTPSPNTELQHQSKGHEQYKNNRVSKLEKIKNTELRKNYLVLRTKKKEECIQVELDSIF